MAFSSFPVYLEHQFQPDHQQGSGVDNCQVLPPPQPPPVGGAGGSIRPGSMVDRARLAKLPLPEAGLKCPRCDSANTKFCYFNNYSLSQPRHFCKTCRRYWTRGGALRNVPVGGGCRRNKKSKSSSKSSILTSQNSTINNNTSTTASPSRCNSSTDHISGHFPLSSSSQLPLMAALQNLNHFSGGFQAQIHENGLANMGFTGGAEQWRLPCVGGFEQATNLFPFQSEGVEASSSMFGEQQLIGSTCPGPASQIASVKAEESNPAGLNNLTKQFLVSSDNTQFWPGGGSPWTGFSGLNSSNSTTHLL